MFYVESPTKGPAVRKWNDCDTGACCIDIDDFYAEPPDLNQKPQCAAPVTRQQCDQTSKRNTWPWGKWVVHTKYHVGKVVLTGLICEE